jgi:putative tricarboxylic transport membrane protein
VKFHDLLSGVLLVVFGVVVALYACTFPTEAGPGVGPGAFPLLIGIAIAGCGAALIGSGLKQPRPKLFEFEEWVRRPRMAFNGALVIGALIFYALAVETLGFFITSFVILAGLFTAFGVRWRWTVPVAAGVTLGLHFAFYTLLRVPLPWGWLEGMAW